jgi:hypothetical protein
LAEAVAEFRGVFEVLDDAGSEAAAIEREDTYAGRDDFDGREVSGLIVVGDAKGAGAEGRVRGEDRVDLSGRDVDRERGGACGVAADLDRDSGEGGA